MPSKKIIITEFDAYTERIEFGDKYIVNKEPVLRKGHWSGGLASLLAFTHLKDKKEKTNVSKHQERSYDKMKLSLSHENSALNKSLSSESIRIPNKTLFIDNRVDSPRKMSASGSIDTFSDDHKSDIGSELSSVDTHSLDDSSSMSSYESDSLSDSNERQNNSETVRVVQRFGNGFQDTCLFPLALTLDFTDLTKGKTTWETINTKADLALNKWCSLYSRKVNRVLSIATDYVCPDPSLQNKFLLQSKRIQKPLKRWNSYEDLYALNRPTQCTDNALNPLVFTEDTLFARHEFNEFESQVTTNGKKRKASETSVDSLDKTTYETIVLQPISNPQFVKRVNSLVQKRRFEAKRLLANIRANSPQSLALYITEIDKQYYLRLKDSQLYHCMAGECRVNQVACILRKLRNWQSLVTIIRALQSPKIYFMEEAWMTTRNQFPIHFNDYLKLCRLVRLNQTCIIGSTFGPSIPTLASLVSRISIHCIATWDLLEHKRRWTEQPSIAGWVDSELIGQLVESQKLRQRQEERYMLSLDDSQNTLLPFNDPIRLIHYTSLPINWRQQDIKYITQTHLKPIVKCFQSSFEKEIHFIRQYNIPNAQN
ncbi:unnamed protein product [Medioppia subpectinata]|uniref:Uncharacterized protein n=1 Tax=Medioppia subpectinata TaxID=1979941 RepID=A0A7R9KL18_9ACAR|nr:unnamed protein product [Medioppia subpectinata]CAG2104339.1 unnamed protein product [Medioppia subpectinata]